MVEMPVCDLGQYKGSESLLTGDVCRSKIFLPYSGSKIRYTGNKLFGSLCCLFLFRVTEQADHHAKICVNFN